MRNMGILDKRRKIEKMIVVQYTDKQMQFVPKNPLLRKARRRNRLRFRTPIPNPQSLTSYPLKLPVQFLARENQSRGPAVGAMVCVIHQVALLQ